MNQRAAIYARVSTARQEMEQTIESQVEALRKHVNEHAWVLEERHIYLDDGYSGARLARPGLDALRDAAADAQFDVVVVYHPDRLARDYVWQQVVKADLERCGCQLQFLLRPISDKPEDQLLLQVQGMFAEYERAQIAERMRRGKLRKTRAGQMLIWANVPYGYRYLRGQNGQPGWPEIEENEAQVVCQMFQWLVTDGISARQITKRLNQMKIPPRRAARWHQASVRGILTNETYAGTAYYNRRRSIEPKTRRDPAGYPKQEKSSRCLRPREEWIPISVPAIIDRETYERAQEQLRRNQRNSPRNTRYRYLLRRLVKCGCGLAMNTIMQQQKYPYYYCQKGRSTLDSGRAEKCTARRVRADRLDGVVWNHIVELLQSPNLIAEQFHVQSQGLSAQGSLGQQIERLQGLIRQQHRQIDRLIDAYQTEIILLDELSTRRRRAEQKVQAWERQIQDLRRQQQQRFREEVVIQAIEHFCEVTRKGLETASFEERRRVVELIVEKVVVTGTEIVIHHIISIQPSIVNLRFDDFDFHASPIDALSFLGVQIRHDPQGFGKALFPRPDQVHAHLALVPDALMKDGFSG
jgi:site-specific DNA recombinase